MPLTYAKINADYVITKVKESSAIRRLLDLGFTPNSIIRVRSVEPKLEAMLVEIRGVLVALRKSVTDSILVEVKN
ncbi:MAG: ferrous iron transport protein A [Clostridia bacterium]|nr:ferrous iron transport protein A [Clostridia bacterium]